MPEKSTRKRGRPRKSNTDVLVKFEIPEAQADYLELLATKFGWGRGINEVASTIVVKEIIELQKQSFHQKPMREPDE